MMISMNVVASVPLVNQKEELRKNKVHHSKRRLRRGTGLPMKCFATPKKLCLTLVDVMIKEERGKAQKEDKSIYSYHRILPQPFFNGNRRSPSPTSFVKV